MLPKIVIVSGVQIFPPQSGGQLRTVAMAESLVKEGFTVIVYSMTGRRLDYISFRPSNVTAVNNSLSEYVNRAPGFGLLQYLCYRLGVPPLWLTLFTAIWIPRFLKSQCRNSHAVIIDFPYLFPVARFAKRSILNTHNLEHLLWREGIVGNLMGRVVKAIEQRASCCVDQVLCCTEYDQAWFRMKVPSEKSVVVAPNGVDPSHYLRSEPARTRLRAELGFSSDKHVILFVASLYAPNVKAMSFLFEFASRNASLLMELQIEFLIVGSVSPRSVREDHVTATGGVERVEDYFSAADWAINPVTEGSGSNLKMAQYLASHLPIFSTQWGKRGLDLTEDEDFVCINLDNLASVLSQTFEHPFEQAHFIRMAERAQKKNRAKIVAEDCFRPLLGFLGPTEAMR